MAGIGFELKKLFAGRGVFMKIRAYAYAGIVTSGTMVLAVVLLLGMQWLATAFGVSPSDKETLVVLLVYAMLFSLLLSSGMQMLVSRYVADQMFMKRMDRVMPSLIGSSLVVMVPGGVLYALLLASAPDISLLVRALNWLLFMLLIPVWLQMAYITAAKDYKRVLRVFALGVGVALLLGFVLIQGQVDILIALMTALVCGYGFMLVGFTRVLLDYFPVGHGSPMAFIAYLGRTPLLLLTGTLSMLGAFAHMFVMWFSPLGAVVSGGLRQASTYDAACFYAVLITLPTSINFIVSVEVNFYQKYQDYFQAVREGGTLSEIGLARQNMITVLGQEIFKLTSVQVFCMVAYVVLMRYFLVIIGFTTEMIATFQILSIGYSGYAVGSSLMLLQLYFNDQRGAALTAGVFMLSSLGITLLLTPLGSLYYGVGFALSGILMYLAALPRLIHYVNNIDYHVFCEQPVLNRERSNLWTRLADGLDRRALKRQPVDPHAPAHQHKEVSL